MLKEPFILREAGSGTQRMLEQQLDKSKATGLDSLRVVSQLGSSTAIKEAIKQGMGVSILSARAVEAEVKVGSLRIVPLEQIVLQRNFYLIHKRNRVLSPLCRAFYDFMESEASKT